MKFTGLVPPLEPNNLNKRPNIVNTELKESP